MSPKLSLSFTYSDFKFPRVISSANLGTTATHNLAETGIELEILYITPHYYRINICLLIYLFFLYIKHEKTIVRWGEGAGCISGHSFTFVSWPGQSNALNVVEHVAFGSHTPLIWSGAVAELSNKEAGIALGESARVLSGLWGRGGEGGHTRVPARSVWVGGSGATSHSVATAVYERACNIAPWPPGSFITSSCSLSQRQLHQVGEFIWNLHTTTPSQGGS
jgi:hypothetical protein